MKSTPILACLLMFWAFIAIPLTASTQNIEELGFYDQERKQYYQLTDYKGKTVILHFFATWCAPCIEELPDLQQYYLKNKHYQHIFPILVMDGSGAEKLNAFKEKYHLHDLPFYQDNRKQNYPKMLNIKNPSVPMTIFIDKNGQIDKTIKGAYSW